MLSFQNPFNFCTILTGNLRVQMLKKTVYLIRHQSQLSSNYTLSNITQIDAAAISLNRRDIRVLAGITEVKIALRQSMTKADE